MDQTKYMNLLADKTAKNALTIEIKCVKLNSQQNFISNYHQYQSALKKQQQQHMHAHTLKNFVWNKLAFHNKKSKENTIFYPMTYINIYIENV
jgi:hypothetical protein